MNRLAMLEVFAGSPDADRLSAEALTLGQALNVGPSQLGELLLTRGLYHASGRAAAAGDLLPARERAARRPGRRQLQWWGVRCSTWPTR